MRKYLSYVMLFSICIFSSCRNYEKEFKALKNELSEVSKAATYDKITKVNALLTAENGIISQYDSNY